MLIKIFRKMLMPAFFYRFKTTYLGKIHAGLATPKFRCGFQLPLLRFTFPYGPNHYGTKTITF